MLCQAWIRLKQQTDLCCFTSESIGAGEDQVKVCHQTVSDHFITSFQLFHSINWLERNNNIRLYHISWGNISNNMINNSSSCRRRTGSSRRRQSARVGGRGGTDSGQQLIARLWPSWSPTTTSSTRWALETPAWQAWDFISLDWQHRPCPRWSQA